MVQFLTGNGKGTRTFNGQGRGCFQVGLAEDQEVDAGAGLKVVMLDTRLISEHQPTQSNQEPTFHVMPYFAFWLIVQLTRAGKNS